MSESKTVPWDSQSLYMDCCEHLRLWRASIPDDFLSPLPEASGDTTVLDQAVLLHVWYHLVSCDINRLSMPGFAESLPSNLRAIAPGEWIVETRQKCLSHALEIYEILLEYSTRCAEPPRADLTLLVAIYETMRIQLQYISLVEVEIDEDLRGTLIRNFDLGWRMVCDMGHQQERLVKHVCSGGTAPFQKHNTKIRSMSSVGC